MEREHYQTRTILVRGNKQIELAKKIIDDIPVDEQKPIRILISENVSKRNNDQNALMWAVLGDIARDAQILGRKYSAETWHEYFKREFLPEDSDIEQTVYGYRKWSYLPTGDRILSGSTTQLTKKGFSDYLEQIFAFGAENKVTFSDRTAELGDWL